MLYQQAQKLTAGKTADTVRESVKDIRKAELDKHQHIRRTRK